MKKNEILRENLYNAYKVNLIHATCAGNIGINNHDRLIRFYGKDSIKVNLLNKLKKESKFTFWWFLIFITAGVVLFAVDFSNWLNIFDLFIVMINIYLVAKRNIAGIYVGLLECIVYGIICLFQGFYGEVINAFGLYSILYIYEIISWSKSLKNQKKYTSNEDELIIDKLSAKGSLIYLGYTMIVFAFSFLLLKYVIGQERVLILGALSMAVSIMGEIMIAKRYVQSYVYLYLGELIGLFIWVQAMAETGFSMEGLTMIVYYLATISNDIHAYFLWKDVYRKVGTHGGFLFARRKLKIKRIIKLRRRYKNLHWNKSIDINKNS